MIRVMIADDQAIYRQLIRATLESEPDIEVVAEAADGEHALALAETHAPHVALLDVRMPKVSGIDVARSLNDRHPETRILMLTISDDSADLYDAVVAGALGYLLKDDAPDRVVTAVRRICAGLAYLSPSMAGLLSARWADGATTDRQPGRFVVTEDELELLRSMSGVRSLEVDRRVSEVLERFHAQQRRERSRHLISS